MKLVDPLIPPGADTERIRAAIQDLERRRIASPTFQLAAGDFTYGVNDYLLAEGAGVSNSGTNQNQIGLSFPIENPIINGCFRINQRSPATNADDTYAHDRWYALTQTNTIAVSTLTDVEDTTPYMARLTQSQAVAQRMGYAQIIEGKNCKQWRGQKVTFSFRSRLSSSANIRYAVLEWTGTEDSVTSDVVLDWTSSTYTANAFFLAASLTISGVSSYAMTANTLATPDKLTVTLGSSFNNLIVFVWTEGTAAQNVTLDIGKVKLEPGSAASRFVYRQISQELALCQRYYWKTFPQGTAPAQNAGYPGSFIYVSSLGAGAVQGGSTKLPVTMRTAPTITTYSPSAASANWYNVSALAASGAPTTAPAGIASGEHIYLFNTQAAGDAAGQFYSINATADAEL